MPPGRVWKPRSFSFKIPSLIITITLICILDVQKVLRRIELSPNSGKATLYLGTRDGSDMISRAGHQCYKIHAVGPKARTKPAHAKVFDYYRPHIKDTQMYTIPEDCPSRIVNDTSSYHASDNLFQKAKSLTDSEEILITHEFTIEDIPEGIPLEDPLYDNLTKRNQNESTKEQSSVKVPVLNNESRKTDKNNIIYESRLNSSVRDENEIPNENEYVKNISAVRNSNTIYNTEADDKIHEVNKDENIKNENEIPKEYEYVGNTSTDENKIIKTHEKFKIMNTNNATNTKNQWENLITKETNTTIEFQDESKVSNEVIRDTTSEIQGFNKTNVKEELELHNTEEKLAVDNPSLMEFHVIDSEKDLDVPMGIEGPIPAIVLPPKNFVAPPDIVFPINSHSTWRRFPEVPYSPYYYQPPYYYKQDYYIDYKPVLPPYK